MPVATDTCLVALRHHITSSGEWWHLEKNDRLWSDRHDMAKQDTALRREETSRTAGTTPYVVARLKETRQLETLHDFKVEMTRSMTVPCATNGQVGKTCEILNVISRFEVWKFDRNAQ